MSGILSSVLTRRRFLQAASASLLAQRLAAYAPRVYAAAPSSPRTLRVVSGESDGPSGTIDPAFSASDPDTTRICLVYERLVILDDGFTPRPQLAESWTSSNKADVWTFKLRQGVTFHSGAQLTAKDVLYTYRRLIDEKTGSPARALLQDIDPSALTAVDDYTVRFQLTKPNVEFPLTIANRFTFIVPEGKTNADLRAHSDGTGPFVESKFVPGEEPSIFVRNERYRQKGLPLVDAVELRAIPEEAARVVALQRGEVDLVMDIPLTAAAQLEKDSRLRVISVRSPFILTMPCWVDTAPFDDVRVRLAMKYVIDRPKMLQLVLGGRGAIANDNPVAPWVQYALTEPARKQDIARAKALLAEAGHKDGITVELWTSKATTGMLEMATVYKAMAAPAGIDVDVKEAPANDYWDQIWLKKPFSASSWSGRPADEALAVAHLSDAKWNETHWHHPEFDQLIQQARATVKSEARKALYQKAQRMLIDQGGDLIPVFVDAVSATGAKVKGWKPSAQKFYKDFAQVGFVG